jgi:replicative DNA helicase
MKQLPNSRENEQAVLFGLMIGGDKKLLQIKGLLESDDFYHPDHRTIFEAIQNLEKNGKPVDPVTVISSLTDENLEKCGGIEYISSLADMHLLTTLENVRSYAEKIKADSQRRKLIHVCRNAIAELYEGDSDYNEIVNTINAAKMSATGLKSTHYSDIHEQISDKIRNGDKCGFLTGIKALDDTLLGFQPGLYTIAGRSSMGKSEISRYLAFKLAFQGARVWYHTLEDPIDLAVRKMLAFLAGGDIWKLQRGWIADDALNSAQVVLDSTPLFFNDTLFTANQLRAEIEVRRNDFDVLFVDQLSYIKSSQKEMRMRFDENIRALYQIAKELEIPVVVMAQINRSVEQRGEKRPLMSDLKESGSIEETSDVVMLLYREGYYNKNADQTVIEIDIAKNKITDRKGVISLKKGERDFYELVKP